MPDVFAAKRDCFIPPNPYDPEKAPRNYIAWNVLCQHAAFHWAWAESYCQMVDDDLRERTGRRVQHESVMHSLSEFRKHLEPGGVVVLCYRGRVCVCPEAEQDSYKAKVDVQYKGGDR